MKKYSLFFSILIILSFLFGGCSRKIYQVAYPTLSDGKYDSEFPYKSCSKELNKIVRTVKKLTAIAYYRSYVFEPEAKITLSQIQNNLYKKKASRELYYNNSVIGSATVIHYHARRLVLLTCAHIVDFPDTVLTYYLDENLRRSSFIQSVSFKIRQNNFVADLPERGQLELLAMDSDLDIAILGKVFKNDIGYGIPMFEYPFGKAKDLEWGSFVYLLGYPKGHQMVTRGIVSQPNRNARGSFLVDGLFNKGFSGGIVLAIKDGVPNFELVGIAGSAAADFEYYLAPPDDVDNTGYYLHLPYSGDVYARFEKRINYGIIFVISAEQIKEFIKENEDILKNKGYALPSIF